MVTIYRNQRRPTSSAVEGSETLKARARAIRDELAEVVTVALAESVGREPTDPTPSSGRFPPGDVDRGLHPRSPDLSTDAR